MLRAVLCVVLTVGVSACETTTPSEVALPSHFATPANTTVIGAAVPLFAGTGPEAEARYAQGWFVVLRVASGAAAAYRSIGTTAKDYGVTLPAGSVACRRLPAPDQPDFHASEPGGPVTATTTTPVAQGPPTRLDPTSCDGEAASADGRTFVSARSASCTIGRCKRNGYMVVTFRSARLRKGPALLEQDMRGRVGRLRADDATGSRQLAAIDDPDCGQGNLTVREVLSDPDRYWRRLTSGVANHITTASMTFQRRTVRVQFNSVFGDDASYAMTSGHGLAGPVVVIGHCG